MDLVTRRYPAGWQSDTVYMLGAFTRDRGDLAGAIGLPVKESGVYEVGCWVAEEHRGSGYAVEALENVLHWAFTRLEAQRVEWQAIVGNTASMSVAERLGFRYEGTLRGRIEQRGERRDMWVAGLLPEDVPDLTDLDSDPHTRARARARSSRMMGRLRRRSMSPFGDVRSV
jgi:RimJ/RimL family protein N-acetyltransferase